MSVFDDIVALVAAAPCRIGEALTGQEPPYVVSRPLIQDPEGRHLDGSASLWDAQFAFYCVAASVEASYNLGKAVMQDIDGKPVGGTTAASSMSYTGVKVEGLYETLVVAQLNQGGI